jgi:hypothetical protein
MINVESGCLSVPGPWDGVQGVAVTTLSPWNDDVGGVAVTTPSGWGAWLAAWDGTWCGRRGCDQLGCVACP